MVGTCTSGAECASSVCQDGACTAPPEKPRAEQPARDVTRAAPADEIVAALVGHDDETVVAGELPWIRVASFTAGVEPCPQRYYTESDGACSRGFNDNPSDIGVLIDVPVDTYTEVRGTLRARAFGANDAFAANRDSLETAYVDGVSLTTGERGARNHVWTFAAGIADDAEVEGAAPASVCPCQGGTQSALVGSAFLCESPEVLPPYGEYANDVLFDGAVLADACVGTTEANDSFAVTLPEAASGPLELRILADQSFLDEDIAVESFELFVR
jgi:hypothetical protein